MKKNHIVFIRNTNKWQLFPILFVTPGLVYKPQKPKAQSRDVKDIPLIACLN